MTTSYAELKSITRDQWKTLVAAQLGWMLDAMDVMLYAFALGAIQKEFGLSSAQAGALASVTLIASAFGGIGFGILADRIGRARSLMISILMYSVFTSLTATAGSLWQLIVWRALVGLGMGGEWSAGSVLVSETWPSRHRAKAIGFMQAGWAIGYILAALLAAAILPELGWRALFLLGILPAFITIWIRRNVHEPEIWKSRPRASGIRRYVSPDLFRPPLLRRTLLGSLITMLVLFAYWGLFTWMPSFFSRPIEQGGAGLGIIKSSGWIIPMQIGAFFGYTSFGFFADRFGRRPVFAFFLVCAAILVPAYGQLVRHDVALLVLGPFIGFFGHGYFSVFGVMLSELFPTHVRGTAQGLVYNVGRAFSAFAPYTIGALADLHGIGTALAITSAFFFLGGIAIFSLPETRGQELQ
jgi:MFS family permease